jgi:hypothetical protein
MQIVADTHLHFYPCYDVNAGLRNLSSNLAKLASDAVKAGFLAERGDCNFFSDLQNGKIRPDAGIEVQSASQPEALILRGMDANKLFLFAGRQIVTAERIEILALTCDARILDGKPADETVRAVLKASGIPVLSWAPGKWFFERGQVVRRLIGQFEAGQMLIGDTSLRPTIWPEPQLMTEARKKGLRLVAGSDPLPFPGEEKYCGIYGTILEGAFDERTPVDSMRKMLMSSATTTSLAGRRCGAAGVALRLFKNAMSKRAIT